MINFVFFGYKIDVWTIVGLFAQGLFFVRFVFQWIDSEKNKKIVVPIIFWYISLLGTFLTLVYAVARKDAVFLATGFLQIILYLRNISIARNETKI